MRRIVRKVTVTCPGSSGIAKMETAGPILRMERDAGALVQSVQVPFPSW